MPAFVAAHPWMTFFLALAAFGTIDHVLAPPQPATAGAPPKPPVPPTTTSGYWHPRVVNDMVAGLPLPGFMKIDMPYGNGVYAGLVKKIG